MLLGFGFRSIDGQAQSGENRGAPVLQQTIQGRRDVFLLGIARQETGDASTTLGRSLLRTASRMFPGRAVLEAYRHDSATTPRPVAFGVVADAAGLAPLEAATISLHSDLTAVAAAAVKLLPIDAAGAFGWVAALATEIEHCAARAATPVASSELPSVAATLVELRSLRHGRDGGRLFAT